MPAADWLRGELAPYTVALLDSARAHDRGWLSPDAVRRLIAEHVSGKRDWSQQLWTLIVLELWARVALDASVAATDSLDVVLAGSAR
jgi:asparagine synthase (glutamine-hydrolysing)